MSKDLISQIRAQRALSDGVMVALLPIMQDIFYPGHGADEIVCGDLGSFARGTNNDISPDLDIGFFGASNDETRGFKDWTPIGTRTLTGKKEGITNLEDLGDHDPMVVQTIQRIGQVLDAYFKMSPGSTQFNFMRSWEGYPGWVCNLSLPHPEFNTIEFDINLGYLRSHYGLEHAQRFDRYFNKLVYELGEETTMQLVKGIRRLKKQGKESARDARGWVNRTQKLAGFVVEGLFMHQYPPHTYGELLDLVRNHRWELDRKPTEHWVGDQNDQIIDAGFSFSQLLENMACDNAALPLGTWKNLLNIARNSEQDT